MDVLTIAQYNKLLNQVFSDLGLMEVTGEVMSKKISNRNALFMELKDPESGEMLKATNFAPWVKGLAEIEEGMQVVLTGQAEIYGPFGSFSFKPNQIRPAGEGSLRRALELLQKRLNEDGFFAPERKRELPEVIKRIALITADGSAALEDFLKILREYNSAIEIDLYPVSVQGQKSVMEIVQTFAQIKEDTEKSDVDAIVLTRGGGSLEDLGSFNSEDVAKAIFSSPTPVVCAVGHEVDISIADMVADVRASTPSQAAYYLASRNEQFINLANQILDSIERSLRELMPRTDQLDNVAQKLSQNIDSILPNRAQIDEQMGMISMKLRQSVPMPESVDPTVQKLNWGLINLDRDIKQKFTKVSQQQELLKAYNPKLVLQRGYSLTRASGKVLKSVSEVSEGDNLTVELWNGEIISKIRRIKRIKRK